MSNQTDLVATKSNSIKALLEKSKAEIAAALPKHLTAERLMRISLTEIRKNPALLECDQVSLIGAIVQCAQLGLEPGGALGHCYLVPFRNKNTGRREVQVIWGYRGFIDLARRSGACHKIEAQAVYEGDDFEYEFGLEAKLRHKPAVSRAKDAKLIYVYAIAELNNGVKQWDVMSAEEVELIRARSQSADGARSPWVTDYSAMSKKTIIRRLFKYLPVSIEIQKAVGLDEAAERGEQDNGSVINIEGHQVNDKVSDFQNQLKGTVVKPVEEPTPELDIPHDPSFDTDKSGARP